MSQQAPRRGNERIIVRLIALIVILAGWVLMLSGSSTALQTGTAVVFGRITDQQGAVIPDAEVEIRNIATRVAVASRTNGVGLYTLPSLLPGGYIMTVRKLGFQSVTATGVTLEVQDNVSRNFVLRVGSVDESITVSASALGVDTTDATVSTVVDQQLVKQLPLNGRSFQTLFQLTPGTVITPTNFASQGQFSVNGQRANANYFSVDGASANVSIAAGNQPGQSLGGSLPALSASGGTNTLVSTDAVQEFAIETSNYAPEFGRTPGAQVSIVTRSGGNQFHGDVFNYLRNDVADANDWFANQNGIARPALRQNDFGGVVGGPIWKDKTFFFFSYEGLRLRQPTIGESDVPTLAARSAAPSALQPFFNAYPLPTGADEGNGLAPATYGFSNPSSLDATSLRIDHHFSPSLSIFGRYNYAPSATSSRGANNAALSVVSTTEMKLQTLTLGTTYTINARASDDFRFNWSQSSGGARSAMENFGGAVAPSSSLGFPAGFGQNNGFFGLLISFEGRNDSLEAGRVVANQQNQINITDNLAAQLGTHLVKVGVDFRRLTPNFVPPLYVQSTDFDSVASALTGLTTIGAVQAEVPVNSQFDNYSLFAQDTWRPNSRLSLTYGLRWDYNPTPTGQGSNGLNAAAIQGSSNVETLSLAPQGAPIYRASVNNFAPRAGFAYRMFTTRLGESVVRGGGGVFYDLGNGPAGNAFGLFFPFVAVKLNFGAPFPLGSSDAAPPMITADPPVTSPVTGFTPKLKLPYTYDVSLSFEQALGTNQVLSLSYIGAFGHSLLRTEEFFGPPLPEVFQSAIFFTTNAGYSKYNALQAQFRRRAAKGLDLLASYTYSHALDNVSSDSSLSVPGRFVDPKTDYGSSDFDIRHTGSVALDYQIPGPRTSKLRKAILSGWSLDPILTARSSPPINVVVTRDLGFGSYDFRPDLTPGVPLYLNDPAAPGDRRINPAALTVSSAQRQGTLPRNFFRGFPLLQTDLGIRRRFPLSERLALQVNLDAFNVINHPNFAPEANRLGTVGPDGTLVPEQGFGISNSMLGGGLQQGSFGSGFSSLYQIGGPRSLQLGMKLEF
jgi:outer membrane receptor protein involved in Fe transport